MGAFIGAPAAQLDLLVRNARRLSGPASRSAIRAGSVDQDAALTGLGLLAGVGDARDGVVARRLVLEDERRLPQRGRARAAAVRAARLFHVFTPTSW